MQTVDSVESSGGIGDSVGALPRKCGVDTMRDGSTEAVWASSTSSLSSGAMDCRGGQRVATTDGGNENAAKDADIGFDT
jgi:hypothetical protein